MSTPKAYINFVDNALSAHYIFYSRSEIIKKLLNPQHPVVFERRGVGSMRNLGALYNLMLSVYRSCDQATIVHAEQYVGAATVAFLRTLLQLRALSRPRNF